VRERPARPRDFESAVDREPPSESTRRRKIERPGARRSHARILLLLVAALVFAVGGLAYDVVHGFDAAQSSNPGTVSFLVRLGDTTDSVANRLERRGLIHDVPLFSGSQLFDLDARRKGLAADLRYGKFLLRRNMSIDQMISALATESPLTVPVTVLPGWRAEQIAATLPPSINRLQFLHAVRHPSFGLGFRVGWPKRHTLEGFLYPDTYFVDPHISGVALARVMTLQFAKEFGPAMRRRARREHRSVYRVTKMASIVQREDGIVSQMPLIAGAYYNRLKLKPDANGGVGHLLQSDPTVAYALGRPGNWWPVVTSEEAHTTRSRFNTYLHFGLPPAPIANPDRASLRAALHPAKTDDYFFASCPGSKKLYFQQTLAQQSEFLAGC